MAGRVPRRRPQIGLQNAKIGRKARGDRFASYIALTESATRRNIIMML